MTQTPTPIAPTPASASPMPRLFLVVPASWLVVLLAFWIWGGGSTHLPTFGLSIPADVVWFGALGGVVASLHGIFGYNRNWDPKFDIWHVAAPVVGGAYGIFAWLFILVIAKTAGDANANTSEAVFALGAFTLGFAQGQFSALIQRVAEVLFAPSKTTPPTPQSNGQKAP